MNDHKTIGPWMKKKVVTATADTTLKEAAKLLTEKRVGTLPVVDDQGKLVGITNMRKIVAVFLPDFISLMEDVDFVKDYGVLDSLSDEDMEKANHLNVGEIMDEAISVEEDCSLVRALSVMSNHRVPDIPVVRDEKLVGLVSRVDVGRGFLETWFTKPNSN